jgi:hypothetical protein
MKVETHHVNNAKKWPKVIGTDCPVLTATDDVSQFTTVTDGGL